MDEFLNTLLQGFTMFRAEIAQLSPAVLAWMWVMRIVLGASIFFLPRAGAVATLAAMIATALSRFYIKGLYPDMPAPEIGALVQLVIWLPLLVFLSFFSPARVSANNSRFDLVYYNWRLVVIAVLAISLAFDIREVILRMH